MHFLARNFAVWVNTIIWILIYVSVKCLIHGLSYARDYIHGDSPLTLNVREPNSVQHGKYHGCWCPGFLCRRDISTRDIDQVK